MKLAVLQATSRPGAAGNDVTKFVYTTALETLAGDQVTLLKLADLNLGLDDEPNLPATKQYVQETTRKWSAFVEEQDVLLWVVPEYNGAYPALLKNAVDHLKSEWEGKKVAFVTYSAGGAKFVPTALETLFAKGVQAQVLGNVSFSTYPYGFDTTTGGATGLEALETSEVKAQVVELLKSLKA